VAGGPPALAAKAWLLMDFDSGEVLASANPDEPLPPASLTKMMTSFLVEQALRSGKLKKDDLVSVSQNAWCRGSSTESCMYLPLNSQATVIDILRGIIIQSGNDASKAIAEHMAGSEEGFAKLMNAEAQRLGMTHTHFVNADGPARPGAQVVGARPRHPGARDHPRQLRLLPDLRGARVQVQQHQAGQPQRAALHRPHGRRPEDRPHQEAGYCLVTSSKRNGMRLITVILNTNSAQARADQTRTLLGWGYGNFEKATPIQPNTVVATAKVAFGKVDTVAAGLGVAVDHHRAARPEGEHLGAAQARPGGAGGQGRGDRQGRRGIERQAGGEAPLVAQAEVERAGFMLRAWQHVQHLHVHVDAGMVARQAFERGRQQVRNGARGGTHPHAARLAGELAPHVFHRVVRVRQQPAGARDEALSQGGRLRGPPPANEQLAAQARLQFGDLHGDGGCGQVKGARGVGQGAEVGNGDQGAQVIQAEFSHADNLTFLNSRFHIFSWSHRGRVPTIARPWTSTSSSTATRAPPALTCRTGCGAANFASAPCRRTCARTRRRGGTRSMRATSPSFACPMPPRATRWP
jgi:D-alanyl-D-alanine carboxypeptidase (penicillin-binding protein 5/6)